MDFFKTDDGKAHRTRIVGVIILVALLASCALDFRAADMDMCAARAMFLLGWWLSFCSKRPATTWSGIVATPLRVTGAVFVVLGIVGQFYVLWRH